MPKVKIRTDGKVEDIFTGVLVAEQDRTAQDPLDLFKEVMFLGCEGHYLGRPSEQLLKLSARSLTFFCFGFPSKMSKTSSKRKCTRCPSRIKFIVMR